MTAYGFSNKCADLWGFSAQICVYTAVYFLCQKTAWLPGKLFSLALKTKMYCFRAGDLFSLQKSKCSENSDDRIVWDNWSEEGLCQRCDWQTPWGGWCCWWITLGYQKRNVGGAAAPLSLWGEVVWIVTYTCVSVFKGGWFPPPCIQILHSFVKGKWLKRLASSDMSVDQCFIKDLSFLYILTHSWFVDNPLLLIASSYERCSYVW